MAVFGQTKMGQDAGFVKQRTPDLALHATLSIYQQEDTTQSVGSNDYDAEAVAMPASHG